MSPQLSPIHTHMCPRPPWLAYGTPAQSLALQLLSPAFTLPISHQLLNARAEIQVQGCLSRKLFLLISVPSQGISTSDDSVLIGGPPGVPYVRLSCCTASPSTAVLLRSHLYISGSKWVELL